MSRAACCRVLAVVTGALALALGATPAWGQVVPPHPVNPGSSQPFATADSGPTGSIGNGDPFQSDLWSQANLPITLIPFDASWMLAAESCNSWTESSSHSPTVSVARLAVPGKASNEYQKGCGALKEKKLSDAEEHERKAIQLYPNYAAAWVVLGQILQAEDKLKDGQTACSQARSVDPNYVAPYLCLANFAATEENWKEVSMLSGSALSLDPAGNAYSFYYAADAEFHLGDLGRAEKDARNSVTLDKWHHLAQIHLLLAEIDAAKSDFSGQAAQLREYLKLEPNSVDSARVRSTLATLDAKTPQDSTAAPK
ncbi:MAG TPA: hypothetical protein VHX36_13885 [Candidatus Acidoferrales bacterium]|nr:hypothetical protein [Candidatus Acidoferrales bacterium]